MQLTLSNNLSELTAEINIYKQQAGQAVFEIGKRLKHVKECDLTHGDFGGWLESIGFNAKHAHRYIQAYEQFSPTSGNLNPSKIFEMLSLPESVDRQQFMETPHTIPSTGETKKVDDMTVKELREVKKALQDAERRANEAENSMYHFQKLYNQEKSKPAQVVTKSVEVIPGDYEDLKQQAIAAQQLNTEVVKLKRANETIKQTYEEKLSQQQKHDYAKKELQKYLSEHLRSMTMNHDSAVFNFTAIQGDREAYDSVMRFLHQYETIIKNQFAEWQQLTSIRAAN